MNLSRIKLISAMTGRREVTFDFGAGFYTTGYVNGLQLEDGSGYSYIVTIYTTTGIYDTNIKIYMRFSERDGECIKIKMLSKNVTYVDCP